MAGKTHHLVQRGKCSTACSTAPPAAEGSKPPSTPSPPHALTHKDQDGLVDGHIHATAVWASSTLSACFHRAGASRATSSLLCQRVPAPALMAHQPHLLAALHCCRPLLLPCTLPHPEIPAESERQPGEEVSRLEREGIQYFAASLSTSTVRLRSITTKCVFQSAAHSSISTCAVRASACVRLLDVACALAGCGTCV